MSKKKKENDRWLMRTREQALNNGIDIPIIKEEPTSSRKVKVEEGADEELDFNDTFADDEGDFGDVFKEEGDREEHVDAEFHMLYCLLIHHARNRLVPVKKQPNIILMPPDR